MAFVDELSIRIKAGNGGDGVVRWRHEKFKEFSGPSGGDGGNGGDVYVKGIRDIFRLSKYQHDQLFEAGRGEDGRGSSQHGKRGQDIDILVPVGTLLKNSVTSAVTEILKEDQRDLLARGGRGGLGNEYFKSSRNQTPYEQTDGVRVNETRYSLELKLIADAGFIGLPNVGKSSLLNTLTKALGKVGNYDFTTLDPNLGVFESYVLADIPGLIEGASVGRGLGHAFLRHITRTNILLHCIALDHSSIIEDYDLIRKEMGNFDPSLLEKRELVLLTKQDEVTSEISKQALDLMRKHTGGKVIAVSILDDASVEALKDEMRAVLKES